MSDRGVFAVDRGIFTDDLFADEPLTEREAWLWIIAEAAWKERRARVGTAVVSLSRGQLCHSVRFMAEAWRWSKSRVDRFLAKLEKRDAISRTGGTATSVVTVCRYDEFQRVCMQQRDSSGTDIGTAAGQQRDKLESIKTLRSSLSEGASDSAPEEDRKQKSEPPPEKPAEVEKRPRKRRLIDYPASFERLWIAFPTDANMSKQEAFKAWKLLDETDQDAVLRAVDPFKSWISKQRDYRTIHLERFIKYRRFDGFAAKAAPSSGSDQPAGLSLPDDSWRQHVRIWSQQNGRWMLGKTTPPPDDPNTRVPKHILAEMNIHPAQSRAA